MFSACRPPIIGRVVSRSSQRPLVSSTGGRLALRKYSQAQAGSPEELDGGTVGPQGHGESLIDFFKNSERTLQESENSQHAREEAPSSGRGRHPDAKRKRSFQQPKNIRIEETPREIIKGALKARPDSPIGGANPLLERWPSLEGLSKTQLRNDTDRDARRSVKVEGEIALEGVSPRFQKAWFPQLRKFAAAGGPLSAATNSPPYLQPGIDRGLIDPIQLRDMCSCELCVDPSSGQKNFWTVDIPANISIAERRNLSKDQGFAFAWENDVPGFPPDHITKLNNADLYYHLFMKTDRRTRTLASCNKAKIEKELVVVDFEAYLNDIDTYKQVLKAVRDNGLAFITNVPESEDSVVHIAEKIGPLRNSFYGMTWDVKSVPKAENVAYTAGHLGFHMDLLYMAEPPKLQFLHCLRSSAEGGASLFSDAYQAIEELYQSGSSLTDFHNHHTVFHYDRNGKKYSQNRPLIGLAVPASRFQGSNLPVTPFLEHVNWSPPFQGPNSFRQLFGHSDQLMKWHTIANQFKQRTEHPDNIYERKMAPGECVIFDNRRMLHARTAFSPGDVGKERWLKGCYVDGDPWESELNVHDI